jgi:transposase
LLGKSVHIDTTTLSLYGDYGSDDIDSSSEVARPERGYAKSKRHDLKQMILLLATTGAASFPVWMEAHSGNKSDQETLPNAAVKMRDFCKQLVSHPEFIVVGDSAIYSNILKHSEQMTWITRVPERIKSARTLTELEDSVLTWKALDNGYRYSEHTSTYQGVSQRWILFFSEAAFARECKTLEKNIQKEQEEQAKLWWHLGNRVFTCKEDCEAELQKLAKVLKYHTVTADIQPVEKHSGRGRPKKGSAPVVTGYQVVATLSKDIDTIAQLRNKKGRFILATNQLDYAVLSSAEVLTEYKAQSGTERGFKFIKDDTFQVDSVFLKTPERIQALMMVMTLCLMVYGVSQYDLREALKQCNETLLSQSQKPTQKPSLLWVYFLFRVVGEVHISIGNAVKVAVANVSHELKQIARHFGKRAHAIYLQSG